MITEKRIQDATQRVWDSSLRFSVTFEELEAELRAIMSLPPLPANDDDGPDLVRGGMHK